MLRQTFYASYKWWLWNTKQGPTTQNSQTAIRKVSDSHYGKHPPYPIESDIQWELDDL